jgi:cyclopropane fatty-acyl-phospholipid synthase-like methyltransferase
LHDFMGATQFRLLTTLGLRDTHNLLDFGCGSLRAGRLLIPYLLPGRYFGVEPNAWLVEEAISNEVGQDQIRLKKPTFQHNDDFTVDGFGVNFDFIVAQSVFSHAGRDIISKTLRNFKASLAPEGLIVASVGKADSGNTGKEFEGNGWIYPGVVDYKTETVLSLIREAGLYGALLPWFHPHNLGWYVMAHTLKRLPPPSKYPHLSGAVLNTAIPGST